MQSLDLKRFEAKPGESLPELLRKFSDKLRFRKSKKQAQIAKDAWLDESYVSRLISGERSNPSRDVLILLGAWGLELAVHALDDHESSLAMHPEDWPSPERRVGASSLQLLYSVRRHSPDVERQVALDRHSRGDLHDA